LLVDRVSGEIRREIDLRPRRLAPSCQPSRIAVRCRDFGRRPRNRAIDGYGDIVYRLSEVAIRRLGSAAVEAFRLVSFERFGTPHHWAERAPAWQVVDYLVPGRQRPAIDGELFDRVDDSDGADLSRIVYVETPAGKPLVQKPESPSVCAGGLVADGDSNLRVRYRLEERGQNTEIDAFPFDGKFQMPAERVLWRMSSSEEL
jgi:hypothetical protein